MKYALTHSPTSLCIVAVDEGSGFLYAVAFTMLLMTRDEQNVRGLGVSHPSAGESRTTADDGWNERTKLEIVQLQREGRNPQNAGSAQLGGTCHVEVKLFVGIFSFLSALLIS